MNAFSDARALYALAAFGALVLAAWILICLTGLVWALWDQTLTARRLREGADARRAAREKREWRMR